MIATALVLGAMQVVAAENGAFQHGLWQGACFRDGHLRGMDDEICRARLTGTIGLNFNRSADGLIVDVTVSNRRRRCHRSIVVSSERLGAADRAEIVRRLVQGSVRRVAFRCNVSTPAFVLNAGDLSAVLRETDGLVHVR